MSNTCHQTKEFEEAIEEGFGLRSDQKFFCLEGFSRDYMS
jgi:hypothetical protein